MSATVDVPEAVRRKALAIGSDGRRWLDDLPAMVAGLEREWGVEVGDAIAGGSGGFVANAVAADGTEAVLKIAIPDGLEGHSPFAKELQMLLLAEGRGYVKVLRSDLGRRAILQERLGRPLSAIGLPVEAQIDIIAATVGRAWRRISDISPPLPTGAQKARFLAEFIRTRWEQLDRPCSAAIVERAEAYTRSRDDAFDASTAVMIHGDAHPANVLEDPRSPEMFKLIDPDGMLSEPAHDLAIPLRDWTDELLVGDPVALGLAWSARLGEQSGTDSRAIWEWAFVERVSTGLFLMELGDPLGARFLDVAISWMDAQP
jgi:streptomycin 6-kinase